MPGLDDAFQQTPEQEGHSISPPYQLNFMGANSQVHDTQLNASEYPSRSLHKCFLSTFSTLEGAVPLAVTPTQSQDHVTQLNASDCQSSRVPESKELDAQPNKPTTSGSNSICPHCGYGLSRLSERNRHIETHLPHSIYCLFKGCEWTGRRQCNFTEHWEKKHSEYRIPVIEGDENRIYDPIASGFVNSIVDGMPIDEVARDAYAEAQDSLGRLGKQGTNVLGRSRELREWIYGHLS